MENELKLRTLHHLPLPIACWVAGHPRCDGVGTWNSGLEPLTFLSLPSPTSEFRAALTVTPRAKQRILSTPSFFFFNIPGPANPTSTLDPIDMLLSTSCPFEALTSRHSLCLVAAAGIRRSCRSVALLHA